MLNAGEGAGAPEDTDDKDWVVVWVVGAEAVAVGGGGLSPAPPSSVAPKGICIGRKGSPPCRWARRPIASAVRSWVE